MSTVYPLAALDVINQGSPGAVLYLVKMWLEYGIGNRRFSRKGRPPARGKLATDKQLRTGIGFRVSAYIIVSQL